MRDLRLALPVAMAWAALAALSQHAEVLSTAAVASAITAGALLLGASCLELLRAFVGRDRAAAVLRSMAVGAGLAVPLLAGAAATTGVPLEDCGAVSLLVLGGATPAEVLVTGCDGRGITGLPPSALLLRADASLAIGATAVGTCDAWLDGSRWLLACGELQVAEPAAWASWATPLREGLLAASERLPGAGGQLLPGLAIGDERRVGPALETAMLDAGLSHLTAVSGANCVIVVGAAFHAAAALGARRMVRVAAAGAALGGFVLLVTPEPSVVRAGTMAAIALLGMITGRRAGAVALLSLAVLLVLAVQPPTSRRAPASRCPRSPPAGSSCTPAPSPPRSRACCPCPSPRSSPSLPPRSCGACPCSSASTRA